MLKSNDNETNSFKHSLLFPERFGSLGRGFSQLFFVNAAEGCYGVSQMLTITLKSGMMGG